MSDQEDAKLQMYLDEAKEQLEGVETDILQMEEQQGELDQELINKIFRNIHTVKGGAGFLGLTKLRDLSHIMEDLLDKVRNAEIKIEKDHINQLLESVDCLKQMLDAPKEDVDISAHLHNLTMLIERSLQQDDVDNSAGEIFDDVEVVMTSLDNDNEAIVSSDETESSAVYDDNASMGVPEWPQMFQLQNDQMEGWTEKGFSLFVISFNYSNDSRRAHIPRDQTIDDLNAIGYTLEKKINPHQLEEHVDNDDQKSPFFVLFATVLSKSLMINYLQLDNSQVHCLSEDENLEHMHERVLEEKDQLLVGQSNNSLQPLADQENPQPQVEPSAVAEEPQARVNLAAVTPSMPEKTTAVAKAQTMEQSPAVSTEKSSKDSGSDPKGTAVNSIRVSVDILDSLMNLAGELVLTRNQLNQNVSTWDKYAIGVAAQRLDSVTSELQASIMDTRMQPIGVVFNKFQRVVRDMSNKLGKQIRFEIEGEDVELDKTIIENIGDPLTHLVRNAIDHGLETPEVRQRAGKSPSGLLKLIAQHEAGYVLIKIQDDGNGIDAEVIKAKALEKGLADKAKLDEMSDKDIIKFIFEPGFSTAAEVTDISGRGVGMDVVFTNLTQLGGTIEIDTAVGQGSTFQVKLPLTLAIIPCLLVAVNNERYALPQVSLVELVRIPPAQVKKRLEKIGDTTVVRLRGNLLPIIRLREFLGIDNTTETGEIRVETSLNIVVVSAGEFRYGIVVDDLLDSEEIVVKPLGQHVRDCDGYAGATILGDGAAALILDVVGIATAMDLSTEQSERDLLLKKAQEATGDEQSLLIIENSPNEQFAIDLSYIHRIERINKDQIQQIGDKTVIEYRGNTLRLFFLHEALTVRDMQEQQHLFLVIFPLDGVEVAIVASNIIDIIESRFEVDKSTFVEPGVIGSAIISENITLLLDLFTLVRSITGENHAEKALEVLDHERSYTALVVDDSSFFREQVRALMADYDIDVILAEDGVLGLQALQQNADAIDLVITDIEMPNMNGLEMADEIRRIPRFAELPIIALSTLTNDDEKTKGHTDSVSEYLVKMDRDLVIQTVGKYLHNINIGASV